MNELAAAGAPVFRAALPELALALLAGLALGTLFFAGLWWTTRRGARSPRPAAWFLGSLLVRMGIALAGFHLVGGGHWERLLACLLGFALGRAAVLRTTRPPQPAGATARQGADRAP